MKTNKKTGKVILQKKDYEKQLIFIDDYIAVNGNYIVKADLIEFESDLIQDKINRNNYFSLIDGKESDFFPEKEAFKNLLKAEEGQPIRITNLFYEEEKTKCNLLTNIASNKTILMNVDFCKIIKSLGGNVTQLTKEQYAPIIVYKNNTLVGLFMPIYNKTILNDINQFIVDNTKFEYEEEKAA